jgi:hypothetical protein
VTGARTQEAAAVRTAAHPGAVNPYQLCVEAEILQNQEGPCGV